MRLVARDVAVAKNLIEDSPVVIEYFLLLSAVADTQARPDPDRRMIPGTVLHHVAEERRLAAAVRPDQCHTLARRDVQLSIFQKDQGTERLAITSHLQGDVCVTGLLIDARPHRARLLSRLLNCLRAFARELRPPRPQALAPFRVASTARHHLEALDKLLQLREPPLVHDVVAPLRYLLAQQRRPVRCVVPGVLPDASIL